MGPAQGADAVDRLEDAGGRLACGGACSWRDEGRNLFRGALRARKGS